MRILLFHHPRAGMASHDKAELLEVLRDAGHEVIYRRQEDLNRPVDEAFDLAVAAGGDGTVERVAARLAGRPEPITILPLGTANNLARCFGLTGDLRDIVRRWDSGHTICLDFGLAQGPWGQARFLENAGVGLFADVMHLISERGEDDIEFPDSETELERDLLMLEARLRERPPMRQRIEVDGEVMAGQWLFIEIMNTPFLGPNLPLAQAADPTDGELDLIMLRAEDREPFMEYLRESRQERRPPRQIEHRRARHVRLPSVGGAVHLDGDAKLVGSGKGASPAQRSAGPIEVTVRPAAIKLLVAADAGFACTYSPTVSTGR